MTPFPQDIVLCLFLTDIELICALISATLQYSVNSSQFISSIILEIDIHINRSSSKCPLDEIASKFLDLQPTDAIKSFLFALSSSSNQKLFLYYGESLSNILWWKEWLEDCFSPENPLFTFLKHSHCGNSVILNYFQVKILGNPANKRLLQTLPLETQMEYMRRDFNHSGSYGYLSTENCLLLREILETNALETLEDLISRFSSLFRGFIIWLRDDRPLEQRKNQLSLLDMLSNVNGEQRRCAKIPFHRSLTAYIQTSEGFKLLIESEKRELFLTNSALLEVTAVDKIPSFLSMTHEQFSAMWIWLHASCCIQSRDLLLLLYGEIDLPSSYQNVKTALLVSFKLLIDSFIGAEKSEFQFYRECLFVYTSIWREISILEGKVTLLSNEFECLALLMKTSLGYLCGNEFDTNEAMFIFIFETSVEIVISSLGSIASFDDVERVVLGVRDIILSVLGNNDGLDSLSSEIQTKLIASLMKLSFLVLQCIPGDEDELFVTWEKCISKEEAFPMVPSMFRSDNDIKSLLETMKNSIWLLFKGIIIVTDYHPSILLLISNKIEALSEHENTVFSHISVSTVVDVLENRRRITSTEEAFQNIYNFVGFIIDSFQRAEGNSLLQKRLLRLLGELSYLSLPLYIVVLVDPIYCLLQHLQRNREDGVRENAAINLSVLLPRILIPSEDNPIPEDIHNSLKYKLLQQCNDRRAVANIINQGLNQKSQNSLKLNQLCLEALHAFTVPVEDHRNAKLQECILQQLADQSLGIVATFRVASFSFEKMFQPSEETAIYFMEIVRCLVMKSFVSHAMTVWEVLDKICALNVNFIITVLVQLECLIRACTLQDKFVAVLKRKNFHRTLLGLVNKFPNTSDFTQHRGICTQLARAIGQ